MQEIHIDGDSLGDQFALNPNSPSTEGYIPWKKIVPIVTSAGLLLSACGGGGVDPNVKVNQALTGQGGGGVIELNPYDIKIIPCPAGGSTYLNTGEGTGVVTDKGAAEVDFLDNGTMNVQGELTIQPNLNHGVLDVVCDQTTKPAPGPQEGIAKR